MKLQRVILRIAALLVPHWHRADWLAEWKSELWYVLEGCNHSGRPSWWNRRAIFFCLGAFRDAVWLRRNQGSPPHRQSLWLQSPSRCLLFLAAGAALSGGIYFHQLGPVLAPVSQGHGERIFAHLLPIAIALLVLPATTSLALGDYPATSRSPARSNRFRRWIFLGLKLVLILPIVYCGTSDVAPLVSATGLQPHATLVGYVIAFRWALIDQRLRCPVCLRLLSNPVSIGQPSRNLLEWYGTELHCVKGHGLLHVPEVRTSYSTERWLDLDASWSSLFP